MSETLFVPRGLAQLDNALPELRAAELKLRAIAAAKGIEYDLPDYAGLRTPADTAQLIKWRNDAVAQARKTAEAKRRAQGGTAVQIKDAGDVAASRAYYCVSPFEYGFHGIGGAFDIKIRKTPAGMSATTALSYLGSFASSCGLRWGGTFRDNPSTAIKEASDPYHFELAQARNDVVTKWAAYAKTNVVAKNIGGGGGVVPVILVGALLVLAGLFVAATSPPDA